MDQINRLSHKIFWVITLCVLGAVVSTAESPLAPDLASQGRIAAGAEHTLLLDSEGKLYGWGASTLGRLGFAESTGQVLKPVRIGDRVGAQVAAGRSHSMMILEDRSLWVTGLNESGQLGLGHRDSVNQWTMAPGDQPVSWVAAGSDYSLAIMEDGSLCAWGANGSGQLGLGDRVTRLWPTIVGEGQDGWSTISAGLDHVLGLKTDGSLWVWGSHANGQLGLGESAPARVLAPIRMDERTDWVAVSAGDSFSLALRADGSLWAWGLNDQSQLGVVLDSPALRVSSGTIISGEFISEPTQVGSGALIKWAAISAGGSHSLALSQDGEWYAWGDNTLGQAGGNLLNRIPVPSRVSNATNWLTIQAGKTHGVALSVDSKIFGLGGNQFAQLGDGTKTSRSEPVEISLAPVSGIAPVITRNPRNKIVLPGATVTFSVEATGDQPLQYRWRKDKQPFGANEASLTLENVTLSMAGKYDVEVRNAFGVATSSEAVLQVLTAPSILQNPEPTEAAIGGRATFSVVIKPEDLLLGDVEFQWFLGSEPLSNSSSVAGSQSSVLLLTGITSAMAGNYSVRVTGSGGVTESDVAALSVVSAPVIVSPPSRQTKVTEGETLELSVGALGSAPLVYQWYFNEAEIPGAKSSKLSIEAIALSNEGNYRVSVTNDLGRANSSLSQVIVESPPSFVSSFGNVAVKQGDPVTLKVAVSGKPHPVLIWKRNGVTVQGFNGPELPISIAEERHQGVYSVQAVSPVGTASTSGSLTVGQAPVILAPPRGGFALNGGIARLTVTAVSELPLLYEWFLNDTAIPNSDTPRPIIQNIGQDDTGLYFVDVRNSVGETRSPSVPLLPVSISKFPPNVDPGEDVSITVNPLNNPGPLTYTWRLNGKKIEDGTTFPTLVIEDVEMHDSGIYSVTISDGVLTSTLFADELRVAADALNFKDQFEDRVLLSLVEDEGEIKGVGDNVGATRQAGEPRHAGLAGAHSVWASWQASANGYVKLETTGSSIDTTLAVYTGNSLESLVEVASDDDRGSEISSEILFGVRAGEIYQIAIDSPLGQEGRIALELEFTATELEALTITSQPTDLVVGEGDLALFSVEAEGEGNLTYQWFLNGGALPEATGTEWTFPNTLIGSVGSYTVSVTDPVTGLVVVSNPAQLYISSSELDGVPTAVNALGSPEFKFTLAQSASQNLQGQSARESISFSHPRGGAPVRGYTSREIYNTFGSLSESNEPDHCGIPGGASQWTFFNPPFDGTVVMDTDGSSFDTILAVYTSASASFDDLVEIACDNNSGLDGLDSRLQFEGSASENYFVVVDGVNGATGAVILTTSVSPPLGATVSPTILSVEEGGNASFEVTFESPQEDITVRWRKNGVLIDGKTGLTLSLNDVSLEDAGEYEAVVTDSIGAETIAAAGTLDILQAPQIVAQPEDQIVFEGGEANFAVTAVADGDLSYQWFFNDAPVVEAPNAAVWEVQSVNVNQVGSYFVEVAGAGGSRRSSVVDLELLESTRIVTPPFSSAAPLGNSLSLSVVAAGSEPLEYQWTLDGVVVPGANEQELLISDFQAGNAGDYRALVSGPGGEVQSSVATLTLLAPPALTTEPVGGSRFVGESISFQVEATGGVPLSYQWSKDGQEIPGAISPFLTLTNLSGTDSGSYSVVVSNPAGTAQSANALLTVVSEVGDPTLISNIVVAPGNAGSHFNVTLSFGGAAGRRYGLEVSANLSVWVDSGLEITATDSQVDWSFLEGVDFAEIAPPGSFRFYRVIELSQ